MKRPLPKRTGTVFVCVLACSLIAITLGASAIHLSLKSARAGQRTLAARQAEWLLDAGVRRSLDQLSGGAPQLEQWRVPQSVLLRGNGTVDFDVKRNDAGYTIVSVTAVYRLGDSPDQTFRRTHSYTISTSNN